MILTILLAGVLSGCRPFRFARSPIAESDPRIAQALAGYWEGTRVDHVFGSEQPAGAVILKPLPDGTSLFHWHGPEPKEVGFTGVMSWAEVDGMYLGYADGMIVDFGPGAKREAYAFTEIVRVRPNREGDQFIVDVPFPILLLDYGELRAELDQRDIHYRESAHEIIIDDTPEKVLGWIASAVRDDNVAPDGDVLFERAGSLAMPGVKLPMPVIAPKPGGDHS